MDNIKDALLRFVNSAMKIQKMQESSRELGLRDDNLFYVYGDILEGIYRLLGEHTETFDLSVTHVVMSTKSLPADRRVQLLMAEYKRNHPEQPNPQFIDPEKMRENVEKVGGYHYQTPEGDWS